MPGRDPTTASVSIICISIAGKRSDHRLLLHLLHLHRREAKRKLCDSYEMFFADKRVIPLLPKLLGKQFFKKKKLPLPVDLGHKNWKEQIERGCSSGLLFFRTGTCSVIRVAKASMERDEIIENVGSAINGVIEFVPRRVLKRRWKWQRRVVIWERRKGRGM